MSTRAYVMALLAAAFMFACLATLISSIVSYPSPLSLWNALGFYTLGELFMRLSRIWRAADLGSESAR